ncbi:hypothetical protein HY624_03220 [Candidatus Uhrbacteria bacterium]|nr:hypothetical protein [Candidatus Uhrbacteria bacterium]
MPTQGDTFDTGSQVEANGLYVCAPCGYKKRLETGEIFPECDSCTRKNEEEVDEDDRMPPSGIWEFVSDAAEDPEEADSEDEKEEDE